LDTAIFAVWSQQWPRLRRAFSFRTAGLASDSSGKWRFDLRIVRETSVSLNAKEGYDLDDRVDWEQVALDDLFANVPSQFRRFIWRYGSDIQRGRERFQFLSQLFLATRQLNLTGSALNKILDSVVEALPDADDGKLLKDDLLSCGRTPYALVPPADPIDIIAYFTSRKGAHSLPPPALALNAIRLYWHTRAAEILAIAENAVDAKAVFAEQLVDQLTVIADPSSVFALASRYPALRDHLIRRNPQLLDSPELVKLPNSELLNYLQMLPADEALIGRVVHRLLSSDNIEIADFFTSHFLELTERRVFDALIEESNNGGPLVARVWQDAVRKRMPELTDHVLEMVQSTSQMGALVRWMNLDVDAGLNSSPNVWAATLVRVKDDIQGQPRQVLLAYFLALGIARPTLGCEPLLERAFESVHSDIAASRLPEEASIFLIPLLPDVRRSQQWDTCLRLRLAIIETYVGAELDPQSFRRLTHDAVLFDALADIASYTKAGRRFLKRAYHSDE
jgi:hypothetical protein